MRVAVIGAGAAGLCALRHLLRYDDVQPVGFELGTEVGGTWNYTQETGMDKRGYPIVSSMYKNLRTNLPKEVMAFPDFPFDEKLPSFVSHTEVAEYLRSYAYKFRLHDVIKFHTVVERVEVELVPDTATTRWRVTYSDVENKGQSTTEEFDSVIVCNGHYTVPLVPEIPGMEGFRGQVMHSHNYRAPEPFRNCDVILLGAGASGQDIAIDLSSYAKRVYLSSKKEPLSCQLPENVHQVPGIERLKEHSVILENGEEIHIDCLLLCTGYRYHFPFLDSKIGLTVDGDERVTPLYKHIFHTTYPSLSFIGLCKTICPFPHFNIQVETVMAVLKGNVKLPPKALMDMDSEDALAERLARGYPRRYAHFMGPHQWHYTSELVMLGQFPDPIPKGVKELYDYIHKTRVKDLVGYKKLKYQLVGTESFKVFDSHSQ